MDSIYHIKELGAATFEQLGLIKSGDPNQREESKFSDQSISFLADKFRDEKSQKPISETIKDFWVKNGDYISIQYTGVESNISRVTKKDS